MKVRSRFRTVDQLAAANIVKTSPALEAVGRRYAVGVTAYVANQIQNNPEGPIAKQYVPEARELVITPNERLDPIGDDVHTPVKGIVHRYPDRALFKITSACAVYCRFCFRKDKVGKASESLSKAEIAAGLDYIRNTKNIFEVILSGGDPLVMPIEKLQHIMGDILANEHVQVLRIHTRLPVVNPALFTPAYCAALGAFDKAVYLVAHINHADELTTEVRAAFKNLRRTGVILLSQGVILKGINNTPEALTALLRQLVAAGVKPYYLHHPDFATGTSHLRITLDEGRALMRALRGTLTGLAWPTYVVDLPGGFGKMPIDLGYMREIENDLFLMEDYKGHKHLYPPEKP